MVQGRLGTIPVAIFQMRPIGDPSDRDLNQRDMIAELRLLALGQYFLDAFYRRAKAYHVKGLPGKLYLYCTSCFFVVDLSYKSSSGTRQVPSLVK